MFDNGFYSKAELQSAGFKALGKNVLISKNITIVGVANISIGNDVRIDDFCMLIAPGNGYIHIGNNVHIAAYCLLSAGNGIVLENYSGLSHGVKVYSRTDDYGGDFLTNPTVPDEYTGVIGGVVTISKHVIVGAGTVILPGITIGEGASVGAQSLITKNLEPWFVYFGLPAKKLKKRKKGLLKFELLHQQSL